MEYFCPEQADKLSKRLCRCFKKEVALDIKIDPSLIGGLFIKVRDRIYDASIRGALNSISRRLAV